MRNIYLTMAFIATILVSACSGSGDSTSSTGDLSGVAAVGFPIVGGTIDIRCATGNLLSATTDSTGAWKMSLTVQTMPCAVQVRNGTINGITNNRPYHSVAVSAGTVNVTPITDLLTANLAGTASPETWFAGLSTATTPLTAITQTDVDASLTKLRTALGSSLPQLANIDPVTTAFTPEPGNAGDDMLSSLANAMQTSGVTYSALLTDASAPTYAAPAATFTTALTTAAKTAELGGAWYRQRLQPGRTFTNITTGAIASTTFKWNRGPETVDASGNVTAGAETASDFSAAPSIPLFVRSFAADGSIAESDMATYHGTISKNKQLIVGTATAANGLDPRLIITMKRDPAVTYSMSDLAGTWDQHMIRAGRTITNITTGSITSTTNLWEHGVEIWDASGNEAGQSGARSDAVPFSPWTDTQSISPSGIITSAGLPTLYGVMSASKDLVVTTRTAGNGIDVLMSIFQKRDPVVTFTMADLAGTWDRHMIMAGRTFTDITTGAITSTTNRWEHGVETWDASGNYAEISGAWSQATPYVLTSGPGQTISASGVITDSTMPTFHGVMSASKDLVVGTRTAGNGVDIVMVIFQKR